MTLTGRNIITAESLADTLDLLDTATQAATQAAAAAQGAADTLDDALTALPGSISNAAQQAAQQATVGVQGAVTNRLALLDASLDDVEQATDEMRSVASTRNLGRAPQAGDPAGTYRVVEPDGDVVDVAWSGTAETARTPALATAQAVEARRLTPTAASMYARALGEQGVIPPGALAKTRAALAAGEPVRWVLAHNSIGEGADQLDHLDAYISQIRQAADRLFGPGKITIYNRSLGGRRMRDLANPEFRSVAGYIEPADIFSGYAQRVDVLDGAVWPAVAGTAWLDEVLGIGAHALILTNTMNITAGADPATDLEPDFRAVLAAVAAHASAPDVILGTDIMPAANFGRDEFTMRQTPELVRLLAREKGLPVIDANRLSNVLMYGVDPTVLETTLVRENWGGAGMTQWRGDTAAWDHSVPFRQLSRVQDQGYVTSYDLVQDGALEWIVRFSAASPEILNVSVRYDESSDTGLLLQVFPQEATLFEFRAGQAPRPIGTAAFPVAFDGVDQQYRIELDGSDVRVRRGGATVIRAASPVNIRPGLIRFGTADAGFKLPAAIINMRVIGRTPVQAADLLTELELLGDGTDATGGNGYNHPTALQYQLTYVASVTRLLASLAQARSGGSAPLTAQSLLTLLNDWGAWADRERLTVTRVGNVVTLRGAVAGGTGNDVTQLPTTYRPPRTVRRAADSNSGQTAVEIYPDGNVASAVVGAGAWVTFEASWEV